MSTKRKFNQGSNLACQNNEHEQKKPKLTIEDRPAPKPPLNNFLPLLINGQNYLPGAFYPTSNTSHYANNNLISNNHELKTPNKNNEDEEENYLNLITYLTNSLSNSLINPLMHNLSMFLLSYLTNNNNAQLNNNLNSEKQVEDKKLNNTDLIKESIEKFFTINNSKIDYLKSVNANSNNPKHKLNNNNKQKDELLTNEKLKRPLEDLFCSCGSSFDSLQLLTHHLKQTSHKAKTVEKQQTQKKPTNSGYNSTTMNHVHVNLNQPALWLNLDDENGSNGVKMVRGQEEWVNNSRKTNNFISQILKCLECSESFETLADLSLHMSNSKHFSKFHPQHLNLNAHLKQATTNLKKHDSNFCKKTNETSHKLKKTNDLVNNSSLTSCKLRNSLVSQTELKCSICEKKFSINKQHNLPPLVNLIQHLQNVHLIRNVCTNCGAYFKSQEDLQSHLLEESHSLLVNNVSKSKSGGNKLDLKGKNNDGLKTEDKLNSSPLLALQMFVNGNCTQLDVEKVSVEKEAASSTSPKLNELRLPAKKRPYFNDDYKLEVKCCSMMNESSNSQLCSPSNLSEKSMSSCGSSRSSSGSSCFNDLNEMEHFTHKENKLIGNSSNSNCILEKMQMGLDHYLTR